jgi:hypothetical protein
MPIERKVRELLGLKRGQHWPKADSIEQWIGISVDEAMRMKPSRRSGVKHRWPLIELQMTRFDCIEWCEVEGFPRPPKSACTFCPFHDDAQWRDMKATDPDAFAQAVQIDEAIRPGMAGPKRPKGEAWFVHRDRIPLAQVDFSTAEDRGQLNFFNNECEGMCGV